MKFAIRRLVVGLVATPVVALVYTLGYYALVLAGGVATSSLADVFGFGLELGVISAVVFSLWSQIDRLCAKVGL